MRVNKKVSKELKMKIEFILEIMNIDYLELEYELNNMIVEVKKCNVEKILRHEFAYMFKNCCLGIWSRSFYINADDINVLYQKILTKK